MKRREGRTIATSNQKLSNQDGDVEAGDEEWDVCETRRRQMGESWLGLEGGEIGGWKNERGGGYSGLEDDGDDEDDMRLRQRFTSERPADLNVLM